LAFILCVSERREKEEKLRRESKRTRETMRERMRERERERERGNDEVLSWKQTWWLL